MLCPQLASAKYIDTWIKFFIHSFIHSQSGTSNNLIQRISKQTWNKHLSTLHQCLMTWMTSSGCGISCSGAFAIHSLHWKKLKCKAYCHHDSITLAGWKWIADLTYSRELLKLKIKIYRPTIRGWETKRHVTFTAWNHEFTYVYVVRKDS